MIHGWSFLGKMIILCIFQFEYLDLVLVHGVIFGSQRL